jgi:transcriptional regulator with XRE-family HTH domain
MRTKMTISDSALGRKIKAIREANGVSIEELATASGLSVKEVRLGEMGTRRFSTLELVKIAEKLKVRLVELWS